ncbi:MAG: VanZ family protein [Bacteroidetes bacterium]|nr:VanZ family protein [Bacteroidota bacterium]
MFFRHNRYALGWALLILILCGIPGTDLPKLSFLDWLRPDKIVHLILFGVQAYLFIFGFKKQETIAYFHENPRFMAVLISILYGGLVEVLQGTVFISRSADVRDALANALGAFIGLWIYNVRTRTGK